MSSSAKTRTKLVDPKGAAALRNWNSETKRAYQGGKSKPLPPKRFNVSGK